MVINLSWDIWPLINQHINCLILPNACNHLKTFSGRSYIKVLIVPLALVLRFCAEEIKRHPHMHPQIKKEKTQRERGQRGQLGFFKMSPSSKNLWGRWELIQSMVKFGWWLVPIVHWIVYWSIWKCETANAKCHRKAKFHLDGIELAKYIGAPPPCLQTGTTMIFTLNSYSFRRFLCRL